MKRSENKIRTKEQNSKPGINRRKFIGLAAGTGIVAGAGAIFMKNPIFAEPQTPPTQPPAPVKTNFDSVKDIPKTKTSLPGPFPGKVIEVEHNKVWKDGTPDTNLVRQMVDKGMEELTGKKGEDCWKMFVEPNDIVGIKVNPAGEKLISTRYELIDVVIENLLKAGLPKKNIVLWDRFSEMMDMAGYTKERFPGIEITGMQWMDETMKDGWKDKNGDHISKPEMDMDTYYWADVDGPNDPNYINQHVVNGKYSYFGKLITKRLTKIINLPVLKNTGNGVSQATKNISYAAIVNTGRLHQPLGFNVNVEVLGFPAVRDKLVLNILDGILGQYEGGPAANAKYIYKANKLYFATDPFAQDYIGYKEILKKRREDSSIKINESPRYTDYLRYAEKVGLGITDPAKVQHKKIVLG